MVTDPVSDMIVRIYNAQKAGRKAVSVPYSQFKFEIAKVLLSEGFISALDRKGKKVKRNIVIGLDDDTEKAPPINKALRVSKPSRRVYSKAQDVKRILGRRGVYILSTPKGILIDREAVRQNTGGEVLFRLY